MKNKSMSSLKKEMKSHIMGEQKKDKKIVSQDKSMMKKIKKGC